MHMGTEAIPIGGLGGHHRRASVWIGEFNPAGGICILVSGDKTRWFYPIAGKRPLAFQGESGLEKLFRNAFCFDQSIEFINAVTDFRFDACAPEIKPAKGDSVIDLQIGRERFCQGRR